MFILAPSIASAESTTTLFSGRVDATSPYESEDKASLIGRLLADVVRIYMKNKQEEDVQVELRLVQKSSDSKISFSAEVINY